MARAETCFRAGDCLMDAALTAATFSGVLTFLGWPVLQNFDQSKNPQSPAILVLRPIT